MLKSFSSFIDGSLSAAGFTWHYFMGLNIRTRDTRIQAHLGTLDLKPETFEVGASFFDAADIDLGDFKRYGTIRWSDVSELVKPGPFMGWKKIDVMNAIKASGLWDPEVVRNVPRGLAPGANLWPKGDRTKIVVGALPKADVGIRANIMTSPYFSGFADTPYENQRYYDTLYRMIYDSLQFVDWAMMCANPVFGVPGLKRLGQLNFGLPLSVTGKLAKPELCALLADVSKRRREFSTTLALDLSHQVGAVKFQPNTPWINPPTRAGFIEGANTLTKPYEQLVFVQAICDDDAVDVGMFLKRLSGAGMRQLLPDDVSKYSKEMICEHLLERIKYQAEKYDFLIIDCKDSAIQKRHIVNTVNQMELGGIFKDVDIGTATKAEICEVVTNYLEVLMEAKALKFAQDKPQ